jgi:hypothetical protein
MNNIQSWSAITTAEEQDGEKPKAKKGKERGGALEQILRTFAEREMHQRAGA